jgi:tetratricopeptide (TPR) repeat protein
MTISIRALAQSILALLFLAVPCFAASGVDILRAKGELLKGKVTAYDQTTEIVTFVTLDGVEHKIPAKDLDQHSAYKLAKSRADMNSAEDRIKLGNFARTIELFAHAGRHYTSAVKLDPSVAPTVEKERATGRKLAAEYCMRHAQTAIGKGDLKKAEEWLTIMVDKLPKEPLTAEASSMLSGYYKKNHEAKDDQLEADHDEMIKKELKSAKTRYDSMLRNIEQGLASTGTSSRSRKNFESAFSDGERVLKELDKVQKGYSGDEKVAELFDGYRKLVIEHMVDAQLHTASSYSTTTNYNGATKALNRALSVDPKNQEVLAARARVEDASSRGGLLRWW